MKATDSYRLINESPLKGIILFYSDFLLSQIPVVKLKTVISQIQTGKTPAKSQSKYYESEDVNWFKPSDIGHGKYLETAKEKFSFSAIKEKKGTLYPKDTLLMIGIGGGVGRVSLLKNEGSSNQQITGISFVESVFPEWAYYYYLVREDYVKSQAKSMSFPILNQEKIGELDFKYPSKEEQIEFCKFLDHVWESFENDDSLALDAFKIPNELKEYTRKQFRLVALNTDIRNSFKAQKSLLSQLKQSILQEAIQGKLTEEWRALRQTQQAPLEPAGELLKRIQAEKAKLIKEKKIKKEKPLPPITESEKPFELPEGWEWCRLGEIAVLKSGNTYNFQKGNENDIPFVKVGDMNIQGNFDNVKTSSNYLKYTPQMEQHLIPLNSIIFPKRGGAIATNKRCKVISKRILIDSNTMAIVFSPVLNFEFQALSFKNVDLMSFGNQSVIPQVNNKDINPIVLAIPPLEEQKAIVEKVESLMEKCRALEDEISQSEQQAQMLMQAVLKEAFEG